MTLWPRCGKVCLPGGLLAWALLTPGCGGSLTGSDEGERRVLEERQWALDPLTLLAADLDLTGFGNGTVDATVEWTFASDNIDLYVSAQACTPEMFNARSCSFKAKADSPTTKPERLSFAVAGGDRYRFWIVNLGPQKESGTLVVGLTQG